MSTHPASYWHALNILVPGNLWKLWDISKELGGPAGIWRATEDMLRKTGLAPGLARKITDSRNRLDIKAEWRRLTDLNIQALVLEDADYPLRLAQIASAPPIIYTRGRTEILDRESLGVVGSRKLTSYGRQAIEALVPPLAELEINIISGMAYGADTAALEACLDNGGSPVAVLASSLDWSDISHPHVELARRIEETGCLVSENAPGTAIGKAYFPLRNRIISGLSLGVLVIEAARRSGSEITARLALEQNREVFAVPGSIFSANSQGTLELIKRGAKCVTSAADIAQEFGWDLAAAAQLKLQSDSSNPLHHSIFNLLAENPATADVLLQKIDKPAHEIIAGLTELEISGFLRRSGDGVYHKVSR